MVTRVVLTNQKNLIVTGTEAEIKKFFFFLNGKTKDYQIGHEGDIQLIVAGEDVIQLANKIHKEINHLNNLEKWKPTSSY